MVLVVALGCGSSSTSAQPPAEQAPAEQAPAEHTPVEHTPATVDTKKTPPSIPQQPEPAAQKLNAAIATTRIQDEGLCVPMCLRRNMARAVAHEQIERECNATCEGERTPPPACEEFISQALSRVQKVPMRRRAPLVWRELSSKDMYCGYSDAFVAALGDAAVDDFAEREAALGRALSADAYTFHTCPKGVVAEVGDTAADAIALCKLNDTPTQLHQDLSGREYLAVRAARLRLEALGLSKDGDNTLLDTLLLSSALAGQARRAAQ